MSERWRVGRKVGRTIYRQLGDKPHDHDPLIGVMDTPELAERAVLAIYAVTLIADYPTEQRNPDGDEQAAWAMRQIARDVFVGAEEPKR